MDFWPRRESRDSPRTPNAKRPERNRSVRGVSRFGRHPGPATSAKFEPDEKAPGNPTAQEADPGSFPSARLDFDFGIVGEHRTTVAFQGDLRKYPCQSGNVELHSTFSRFAGTAIRRVQLVDLVNRVAPVRAFLQIALHDVPGHESMDAVLEEAVGQCPEVLVAAAAEGRGIGVNPNLRRRPQFAA